MPKVPNVVCYIREYLQDESIGGEEHSIRNNSIEIRVKWRLRRWKQRLKLLKLINLFDASNHKYGILGFESVHRGMGAV